MWLFAQRPFPSPYKKDDSVTSTALETDDDAARIARERSLVIVMPDSENAWPTNAVWPGG